MEESKNTKSASPILTKNGEKAFDMESEGLKFLREDQFFPSLDSEYKIENEDSVGLCFPSPSEINRMKEPSPEEKIRDDVICFF